MKLYQLLSDVQLQGNIYIRVYDPNQDLYTYEWNNAYYSQENRQKYADYEITHIYPHCNGVAVEISTEENTPAAPQPLRVCYHCLLGIEAHEGKQITREIYLDEDDETPCDWCEDTENDVLYEIL